MDRRQILVVDDYAGARYLRSRILTDAGYEVVEAENGEDALRLANSVLPALILLDVNLPDITAPRSFPPQRVLRRRNPRDSDHCAAPATRAGAECRRGSAYLTEPSTT